MAKVKTQFLLPGIAISLAAMWLLSKPNCNRGCQTLAEHLLEHGIRDIILGL